MRTIDLPDNGATKPLALGGLGTLGGNSVGREAIHTGSRTRSRSKIAVTGPAAASPQTLTLRPNLDQVLEYVPAVRTLRLGKGKHVVIAGNAIHCFYVNHEGWLFRYKILHNGNRQVVDFVLPGEVFALQSCLFKTSLYSIATVTPVSFSVIPFDVVDDVFLNNPRLAKAVFWSTVREMTRNVEHLTDAARRSAHERLSHLLLELFVRLRMAGLTEGMSFQMPLTQDLLADALGLTAIHVNRTLRRLREEKFLRIENRRITILNFEELSSLCDFESSYLCEYNLGP